MRSMLSIRRLVTRVHGSVRGKLIGLVVTTLVISVTAAVLGTYRELEQLQDMMEQYQEEYFQTTGKRLHLSLETNLNTLSDLRLRSFKDQARKLVRKDSLVMTPLVQENAMHGIKEFLSETVAADKNIIEASLVVINSQGHYELWQRVSEQFPGGIVENGIYDPISQVWKFSEGSALSPQIDPLMGQTIGLKDELLTEVDYLSQRGKTQRTLLAIKPIIRSPDLSRLNNSSSPHHFEVIGYLRYLLPLAPLVQEAKRDAINGETKRNVLQKQGEARLQIAGQSVEDVTRTSFYTLISISLLLLVVGAIVIARFTRVLLAPLDVLLYGVQEIGRGNLQHRLEVDRNDEFGILAEAVNRMSTSIVKSMHDREERGRIESELQAAEVIQTALLPESSHYPGVDVAYHYKSAAMTGGDWYGAFHDNEQDKISFFVGDVTGHGVGSGLLTGIAHGSIYTAFYLAQYAENSSDVESHLIATVRILNEVFLLAAKGEKNLTAAFVTLDMATQTCFYLNAGHPLLIKSNFHEPGSARFVRNIAPPIGFAPTGRWKVKTLPLSEEDILFLYTDGLVENAGPDGTCLMLNSLKDMVASENDVKTLTTSLLNTAASIWDTEPAMDDVTTLAIKWRGAKSTAIGA